MKIQSNPGKIWPVIQKSKDAKILWDYNQGAIFHA